ncbi:MAG TPA: efflux RND transporter permease subunit [Gemmatimonadales bacterium]|nr:efflux RND transporter permease subunit [Gemmatimonadales bacterium]
MISWAAERPAVIWASAVALVLAGALALARLPVATKPYVELPRLTVSMNWPGASAELVETYLGSPIEAAIQSVRGIRKITSESGESYLSLDIELEPGTDVRLSRLGILERLELLRPDFPAGSGDLQVSNYVPEGLDEEPLLSATLYGPYTAGTLEDLVERQIKPRLNAVPGVAGVSSMGGALVGVAVAYQPERLRQLGIEPSALSEALARAREVQAIGVERGGATERQVVLRDTPEALEQLGELPVRGAGSRVHRLADLATIRMEEDNQDRFFRVNGEPAVMMRIARLPGADAIRTARDVRAVLDELRPALPAGIRFQVLSDESIRLGEQLGDLGRRGAIAFAGVLLVLAIALRAPRAVILVLTSAAVAVAGTTLGLYLLNIPANLLTLAGLGMGVGILVQNGLIVVDRLRTAPDTVEGRADAGRRITPAVLGSTLTTAVVLFPFLYLQGDARAAFMPFAAAFSMALGWSVVTSVVMIPALGKGHGVHEVRWPRLRRWYLRVAITMLRWRWVTIGATTVMLAGLSYVFAVKVPRSSFAGWWNQRTTLSARVDFPSGSDPGSIDQSVKELERIVVGREGVENVQAQGTANGGYVIVTFDDAAAYTAIPLAMQEELTQRAVLIGGAAVSVSGRGPGFYNGAGVGSSANFRVKILGYSFAGVEQLAIDLKQRLERIPRVKSVDINAAGFWFGQERASDVTLVPNRALLAGYGLDATQFAQAVSREVGGAAGRQRFSLGDKEVWLSLKTEGARARTLDQLREARVPNPRNIPVRVGDLATVEERAALARISRENQQYVRVLSYEFRGPQKLANRTHEAFMKSISVPAGYTVSDEYFGWQDDESQKGLWLVFAIGLVLVVLTVAMVFDSVWGAAMVFLSLPIALGGVIAAFWIAKEAFTREAAVGVILVIGLAVNQSILLVDGVLQRSKATQGGRSAVSPRTVIAACRDRVGMIVLITLTTLASPLPLAVGTEAQDLFGAIALALVGGTVAGTIGALFLVPPLLLRRTS